jgi:branched-chain amino acid transport system ATP-binding protein
MMRSLKSTWEKRLILLKVDNIVTSYGPVKALKGVSLEVHRGEIVSVIGANGAGKTTLLKCISRILPLLQGHIYFSEEETSHKSPRSIVKLGISQVPEGRRVFPTLSVKDNLNLGAYLRFKKNEENEITHDIENLFKIFPILRERQSQMAGSLSGGEQQMLAIGRALMSKPKLLLLDEPSMGLAPLIVMEIFNIIRNLNQERMTILLVEQNTRIALKISMRAYVMETGNIVLTGNTKDLVENEKVKQAYLGE